MKRSDTSLTQLYAAFVAKRTEEGRVQCAKFDRKNSRQIDRLVMHGVTTTRELIDALPRLPPALRDFGIWWFSIVKSRGAEGVLLQLLHDEPKCRLSCAAALSSIGGKRSAREFIQIGETQLAMPKPDSEWLDVVIQGLRFPECRGAEEILLTIFERTDLPGWLRGDTGDALSCCPQLQDRRTSSFRRAWKSAMEGIFDPEIEMQFWSMYVIANLAMNDSSHSMRSNHRFDPALPRLREIQANDHRLAPGFWWPMSAEAEDVICVINTGHWPEHDAGDRWHANATRGPMNRS